jgi:hypothetical protein
MIRTLEHFYQTITGERPEYDRTGQLKFAFDRDVHFTPADMDTPRPEYLLDLVDRIVKWRANLIGELSFLDERRREYPAEIESLNRRELELKAEIAALDEQAKMWQRRYDAS